MMSWQWDWQAWPQHTAVCQQLLGGEVVTRTDLFDFAQVDGKLPNAVIQTVIQTIEDLGVTVKHGRMPKTGVEWWQIRPDIPFHPQHRLTAERKASSPFHPPPPFSPSAPRPKGGVIHNIGQRPKRKAVAMETTETKQGDAPELVRGVDYPVYPDTFQTNWDPMGSGKNTMGAYKALIVQTMLENELHLTGTVGTGSVQWQIANRGNNHKNSVIWLPRTRQDRPSQRLRKHRQFVAYVLRNHLIDMDQNHHKVLEVEWEKSASHGGRHDNQWSWYAVDVRPGPRWDIIHDVLERMNTTKNRNRDRPTRLLALWHETEEFLKKMAATQSEFSPEKTQAKQGAASITVSKPLSGHGSVPSPERIPERIAAGFEMERDYRQKKMEKEEEMEQAAVEIAIEGEVVPSPKSATDEELRDILTDARDMLTVMLEVPDQPPVLVRMACDKLEAATCALYDRRGQ